MKQGKKLKRILKECEAEGITEWNLDQGQRQRWVDPDVG